MNLKLKSIYVALLLISLFSFGQNIDVRAQKIIDLISNNYKTKQNTYFKFLYETGKGKVEKRQVGIFYTAQNKFKLNIMGEEQIFDGNKIYNISAEDQEVTIAKPNGSEGAFSPLNYIDNYKKGYTVSYLGKRNSLDIVKLVPVKNNGIKQVLLHINSGKKQLVKVEQTSNNGEIAIITVSQYKENQKLNPSLFSFNKANYKNYLITEL